MKRSVKRLCCAMLAVWLAALAPLAVSAETVEEIRAQQQQLEEENQELNAKLESLREDEAQKQAYRETLQEQIDLVQQQVLTTRENIQRLNESIEELTLKLEASQREVQETIDAFKERLVALYTAGSVSTLEILLDAGSLAEFTTRMTMMEAMTAHDQELVDKLEAYMASTQADREQCQAEKEEVAALQVTLEDKQKELDSLYEENEAVLEEIQGQQYATENLLLANEEELAEGEARIQAAIEAQKKAEEEAKQQALQQQQSNGEAHGSPVVNPPPIVAVADGQVIEANDYDSWGYSWGYYVLIYHNGTYSTRYAHLSSVAVSTGQYVTAGTIIGYEGDTGNAYGPHLHFEVYENGSRVDPALFL